MEERKWELLYCGIQMDSLVVDGQMLGVVSMSLCKQIGTVSLMLVMGLDSQNLNGI